MASSDDSRTVQLSEYQPPAFLVDTVQLRFDLRDASTTVHSVLAIRRNPAATSRASNDLLLDGEALELLSIAINGIPLDSGAYETTDTGLRVFAVPDAFSLAIAVRIDPASNTALEGLYRSRGMYCTQCEAEGFRRITYFPDRPDVLAVYTVEIEADRDAYPVLLSNGNFVRSADAGQGRHLASWHDPHPKPSYLFALVAGQLSCESSTFRTASGRDVLLQIWVEEKDLDKCAYALHSLTAAMRWDEQRYGREYDLDVFNIVAVDDFNMGAMENKGLNIFNTSCVLASPEVTTDAGYARVESIVAHEYFHNWSGNRVTCRDWFQLSLKEGFTVFRDNQFSADQGSIQLQRIEHVKRLRAVQFAEDGGPMAHPVRPDSYQEISNFYTATVYEKGAEVVRMLHTLLGAEQFRNATDLYFSRHDGQAVTCEDFLAAMEAVSGRDLSQFKRWYTQAGTPQLQVAVTFAEQQERCEVTLRQSTPATPGQAEKLPLHVPVALSLLGAQGELSVQRLDHPRAPASEFVLELRDTEERFSFTGVSERPVISALRGLSAPARLQIERSEADYLRLWQQDSDGVSSWDAGFSLYASLCDQAMRATVTHGAEISDAFLAAFVSLLNDDSRPAALRAELLQPPSLMALLETYSSLDVPALHAAREAVLGCLGRRAAPALDIQLQKLSSVSSYQIDANSVGRRRLQHVLLALRLAGDPTCYPRALELLENADNLTDRLAGLQLIARYAPQSVVESSMATFYQRWEHEPLVVNQWLQVQAAVPSADTAARIPLLLTHPAFERRNPNRVRAVLGTFAHGNPAAFHSGDERGYRLLGDEILMLDALNPQIAARLALALAPWSKFAAQGQMMRLELERLRDSGTLSRDLSEIVQKSLDAAAQP